MVMAMARQAVKAIYTPGLSTSSSPDLPPAAAAAGAGGLRQPSKATIKVSVLPPST